MNTHSPSTATGPATRREFLKTTTAGAAALGTLSLARAVHAAGDDVIKIGMIGCGGRCSGAASESLKAGPDVRLVAMYDVFADRIEGSLQSLQQMYPETGRGRRRSPFHRFRWLPEGNRQRGRRADCLRVQVSPDVRGSCHQIGQARLCGKAPRHRPGGTAPHTGRV